MDVDTSEPHADQITLHQIRLTFEHLTTRGYLTGRDRKRLQACLEE